MAIYDKPVRLLMRDMADSLGLEEGKSFTKQQVLDWFARNYPKIKKGTIAAHLIRLSTNAPSRLHYNAKESEDDIFYQIDGSHFRLYDATNDPAPIRDGGDSPPVEPPGAGEGEPVAGSTEFAYEADLKNYLARNLSVIEPGLSLYEDDGINGVEFPVGGRYIDILAVDDSNNLVVIELKVSRGYDRVVGQLMRYVAWISKNHADAGQNVRGIIVAREISEDLLLACGLLDNVELFEYELSLALKKVEESPGA
jgi:hypothetical protein